MVSHSSIREDVMIRVATAVLLTVLVMPAAASAQGAMPDSENGRYTFSQTGESVLRLDSRTGGVSVCVKRAAGWACEAVPDERAALENEIGRLQNENVALKKEMIAKGIPLPSGVKTPDNATSAQRKDELILKLPSDAEMEKVMTFFEKMWRRLVEMVQGMQKEMEKKS
jgi:hypothetical protein